LSFQSTPLFVGPIFKNLKTVNTLVGGINLNNILGRLSHAPFRAIRPTTRQLKIVGVAGAGTAGTALLLAPGPINPNTGLPGKSLIQNTVDATAATADAFQASAKAFEAAGIFLTKNLPIIAIIIALFMLIALVK